MKPFASSASAPAPSVADKIGGAFERLDRSAAEAVEAAEPTLKPITPLIETRPAALWWVLFALVAAMANSTAASPLYALFQTQWGFSATMLTLVYACYSGGVLVTLLSLGPFADRFGDRRRLMMLSLIVVGAGALCIASASSIIGLIGGRILSGIGTGALTGTASAALVELLPAARRKHAAMLTTTAITAGAALGPALSAIGLATSFAPTRLPFILTALAAFGSAIGLWRLHQPILPFVHATPFARTLDTPPSADTMSGMVTEAMTEAMTGSAPPTLSKTLRPWQRPFVLASAALALCWAGGGFAMTLAPWLAADLLGIHERALLAILLCALQVLMGATQILSRYAQARTAMIAGICLTGVALPICAIASASHGAMLFCAGILLIGLGYGSGFVGTAGVINQIAAPERRASVASAFYVVGYAGSALPIMAFGAAADTWGLLVATVLFATSGAMIAIALLRQHRHLPAD